MSPPKPALTDFGLQPWASILWDEALCFIDKNLKFGQLIIRQIIKIIATRCQILRLKRTKIDSGWGSAPDPTGRAYSAPPDSLDGFKGPYF